MIISYLLAHPRIRQIRNYHEWLGLLIRDGITAEEVIGLLHCGFSVPLEKMEHNEPLYDPTDRLIFFLEMAEGWTDCDLLRWEEDPADYQFTHGRKKPSEVRQRVATEAFNVLVENLFSLSFPKNREDSEGYYNLRLVTSNKLFPFIQSFFRIGEWYGNPVICNLHQHRHIHEGNPYVEKAVKFLLRLYEAIWISQEDTSYSSTEKEEREQATRNEEIRQRLNTAKPWLVEVLSLLRQLDLLEKHILSLDRACLNKLKAIAMEATLESHYPPLCHDIGERRKVRNLDEARLAGSKAAWLLQKRTTMTGQLNILGKIRRLELKQVETARELERLNPLSNR